MNFLAKLALPTPLSMSAAKSLYANDSELTSVKGSDLKPDANVLFYTGRKLTGDQWAGAFDVGSAVFIVAPSDSFTMNRRVLQKASKHKVTDVGPPESFDLEIVRGKCILDFRKSGEVVETETPVAVQTTSSSATQMDLGSW
jgi:hypothetical protein